MRLLNMTLKNLLHRKEEKFMHKKRNYNKNNSQQNRTKEIFDKVVKNLQTIVDNGDYEKFLKFQKNFRKYSFNNLVFIYSQFPDATKVAR